MSVVEAIERDLAALRKVSANLADSTLAALALALAVEMDSPRNSATSKSMCARALTDVLEQLRALTPAEKEADRIDDLTARREARRAGGAGA